MSERKTRATAGIGTLLRILNPGVKAFLVTGSENTLDEIRWVSRDFGTGGNSTSVEISSGGSLAVSVTGSAITVTVGTGSTVDDVIKAVNASAEANALVKVSRESNTTLKTGIVQAQASANLANGSDTATWAIIAEVTNFNRSGLSASVTEVTHFCSPDQVKEKISSVVDSGDATMTANFVADDIESQSVMRNSLLKNELRKFDVVYGGTYTSHRFDALVTSFDGIQASIEDAITMEIGLTLSGKPSFIDVTE